MPQARPQFSSTLVMSAKFTAPSWLASPGPVPGYVKLLVHESDAVLVGRVESMASRLTDNGGAIVTDVSIRVLEDRDQQARRGARRRTPG